MFEVHTNTFCGGWLNLWSIYHKDGTETPQQFESQSEAQYEIDELIRETVTAFECGDMEEPYSHEDYRIYNTATKEYVG